MRASLAAIVIFLGGISLAQVEPGSADAPVPSSIRGSKERYDDALKQAEAAYRKAKLAATNAYLRDVKGAVAEATKVGNLDQATVLNGIKKQLEAEVKNISAGVVRVESKIVAGKRWQSVMPVHTGETLKITAVGTWCAATLSRDDWTSKHRFQACHTTHWSEESAIRSFSLVATQKLWPRRMVCSTSE
jgi:hypothetical protein